MLSRTCWTTFLSICLASEVPQASPCRASSRIFSGSENVNVLGRGVFGSAVTFSQSLLF
jgi:hypothetical protein